MISLPMLFKTPFTYQQKRICRKILPTAECHMYRLCMSLIDLCLPYGTALIKQLCFGGNVAKAAGVTLTCTCHDVSSGVS